MWFVETLSPALLRLSKCCVQAEASIQNDTTDLDEPLLITQRRQQAKQAVRSSHLEYFSVWFFRGDAFYHPNFALRSAC